MRGDVLTAAACGAGDDSWVVRPPGGGGGGVGGRVDAAPPTPIAVTPGPA
ncbi:MAG: hypothetical protein R3B06_12805 [Kofleriaceae bacterium]